MGKTTGIFQGRPQARGPATAVVASTRRTRVRWLGYDSGIKPGEQACTVAGRTAAHGTAQRSFSQHPNFTQELPRSCSQWEPNRAKVNDVRVAYLRRAVCGA